MDVKMKLESYSVEADKLKEKIMRTERHLADAKAEQTRFGAIYDKRVADLKLELLNLHTDLHKLEDDVCAIIETLPKKKERSVLKLLYIEDKDWYEISKVLNYSIRWVQILHQSAMKQLTSNNSITGEDQKGF